MATGKNYVRHAGIDRLPLVDNPGWRLACFDLELTARCNLDCRHCYIRLPAASPQARHRELTARQISVIAEDAARLGAISCLITGGEPLVRPDFPEIYRSLKTRGLVVTVFTNGTLLDEGLVTLFSDYPPRYVEITVYGATPATFEAVTRVPGSYAAFRRGLDLIRAAKIPLRLKSMLMRTNMHEQAAIREFCTAHTPEAYRFDPFLHLRFDRDEERNRIIRSERLTPEEVVKLETADGQRYDCLQKNKHSLILNNRGRGADNRVFFCGAGKQKCVVGWDGHFRLCESLMVPECLYDLRTGTLEDAMTTFVPAVRETRAVSSRYLETCGVCPLINLCMWCPAHACLETGRMDMPVAFFCALARERGNMLDSAKGMPGKTEPGQKVTRCVNLNQRRHEDHE